MKTLRNILFTSAAAALVATPLLAADLAADAMLGATPEDMTTMKMVEDSAFINNEVVTNDQKVIGLVKGVATGADGSQIIFVELSSDIAAKSTVKNFTVTVPADMTADGGLTLAWNEAELFKQLDSGLTTTGSDG